MPQPEADTQAVPPRAGGLASGNDSEVLSFSARLRMTTEDKLKACLERGWNGGEPPVLQGWLWKKNSGAAGNAREDWCERLCFLHPTPAEAADPTHDKPKAPAASSLAALPRSSSVSSSLSGAADAAGAGEWPRKRDPGGLSLRPTEPVRLSSALSSMRPRECSSDMSHGCRLAAELHVRKGLPRDARHYRRPRPR